MASAAVVSRLETLVKHTVRVAGVPGLLCIPFAGMALEKCLLRHPRLAARVRSDGAAGAEEAGDVPAGGHTLPSFSVVPVRHVADYFR